MATNTKGDIEKILAARNTQVKIESLQFEIKKRDQKIEKMRIQINNLEIENQKLKEAIRLYENGYKPPKTI